LVADHRQLACPADEARVRGVDAFHVGEDLAAPGTEAGRPCDRGRVAPAAPERRDLVVRGGARALALEARDDDDLAGSQLGGDATRLAAGDACPAIAAGGGGA